MRRKWGFVVGASLALLSGACGPSEYGITSELPLGNYEALDALLGGKKKLAKEVDKMHLKHMDHDPETSPVGFDVEKGTRYSYIDKARVGALHSAYVFIDSNTKVAGVGAEFRSDERGFDYGVYKVSRFIADFWVSTAGAMPKFQASRVKEGMIGKEMLIATFEKGPLKGRWVKHVMGGGMRDKIIDEVIVCFK